MEDEGDVSRNGVMTNARSCGGYLILGAGGGMV